MLIAHRIFLKAAKLFELLAPFVATSLALFRVIRIKKEQVKYCLMGLFSLCFLVGCNGEKNYSHSVYLLLDTSGTYTKELNKAQRIINYLLGTLNPGDSLAVARIDSDSFSEKDIIAKATFDSRPSMANSQKRQFAEKVELFTKKTIKGSRYTDISGGLLQAVEYINETGAGKKTIFIFSDLKEDLPKGYVRDFELELNGFTVSALNVTKLRSDNVDPSEYIERLKFWRAKVEQGGGQWRVINDLDRGEELLLP